jgi:hypothetical protein
MKEAEEAVGDIVLFTNKNDDGNPDEKSHRYVIDDYATAEKFFSSKYLYAMNECRNAAKEKDVTRPERCSMVKEAFEEYNNLPASVKKVWEMKKRQHLERQPLIKDDIIHIIRSNPKISWDGIAEAINHWCSASTIQRWVTTRDGYRIYTERIVPLLTPKQKKSHLNFAKHFQNNWSLGGGKYLLIMYNEKWFWGLVARAGAKACDELGIDANTFHAYHKCHINKTMGIAFTGFAFQDTIENGGEAIKLGFFRAQSHKIAQKMMRKYELQDDGSRRQTGPVIRKKGDAYLVDCNVTGSTYGTDSDPKFPLIKLFKEVIFPMMYNMVSPGEKYEGYIPIFQGDNAGPHQDAVFFSYVTEYCNKNGWKWEPQAAQMPHMNVLDLSVFPAMSRHHIKLARERGGLRVLKQDEIWNTAELVWKNLPSCKIASAYVQAHRIVKKLIQSNGSNEFLGVSGSIHVGIRADFQETDYGLVRKDGTTVQPPVATQSDNLIGDLV